MEHYTKSTVSAAAWCNPCRRQTQHRVDNGRKGPCLECINRAEDERAKRLAEQSRRKPLISQKPEPEQRRLFS